MFQNFLNFPCWAQKVMNWVCLILFHILFLASVYIVVDKFFVGFYSKCFLYLSLCVVSYGLFFLLKKRIKTIFVEICSKIISLPEWEMFAIIIVLMIVSRLIFGCFWGFDSTQEGDIHIYAKIANQLNEGGQTTYSGEYPHLLAMGFYLSAFSRLHIPFSVGVFILFVLGTLILFTTFKKILGKEKAFIAIILYLMMPSTCLYSFCVTHEIFFYFFTALVVYLLIGTEANTRARRIINWFALLIVLIISYFIGMMTPILFIVLAIVTIFSSKKVLAKVLISCIIPLSLMFNSIGRIWMNQNLLEQPASGEIPFVLNLIIGATWDKDGRDNKDYEPYVDAYLVNNNLENTYANYNKGCFQYLQYQYKYLLSHPGILIELLAKKTYIAWSGNHYSVELAAHYHASDGTKNVSLITNIFLGVSELIYLMVIVIGLLFSSPKTVIKQELYVPQLFLFGVVIVLLIVEIMNKYSSYMTLYIFFIAFSRFELKNDISLEKKPIQA